MLTVVAIHAMNMRLEDADSAAIERVKQDLLRFRPVSKVLRGCGTELEEVWNVRAP